VRLVAGLDVQFSGH